MPIPPPPYNFASLPEVTSRDALAKSPGLALQLAKGEGYLGKPRGGLRETLTVDTATGRPNGIVVFPKNTSLPIMMAFVTGGIFLGMLIKAYWLVPLAGAGVVALSLRWVWGLGHRCDQGLQDAGLGLMLPFASETADPPGWWGSVFLLIANATFFGCLIFGYAFLWTVAPNWPPPEWAVADALWLGFALSGAVIGPVGIRWATVGLSRDRSALPGLVATLIGVGALFAGAATIPLSLPDPTRHAYDATLWVIGGYALFHAALGALMSGFLIARSAAGFLSARRLGEARIVRLWVDYSSLVTLAALAAAFAPGLLS
jgi:cytochrome c oxidase subunit I+III